MLRVMIDRIRGGHRFTSRRGVLTGVQITVKTREVAAADLESHPVPFAKEITGGPQVESEFVRLAGIQERGLLLGLEIARPDNSFCQILCESCGPDMDKLGAQFGIHR